MPLSGIRVFGIWDGASPAGEPDAAGGSRVLQLFKEGRVAQIGTAQTLKMTLVR
jgi:hypothetical protein